MIRFTLTLIISILLLTIFVQFVFRIDIIEGLNNPNESFRRVLSNATLIFGLAMFCISIFSITQPFRLFIGFAYTVMNLYIKFFKHHGVYYKYDEYKERYNDTVAFSGVIISIGYITFSLLLIR